MKKVADIFVTAYLLLLFVVYPFYMKEGYVEIGQAKADFWMKISAGAAIVFTVLGIVMLIQRLCTGRKQHAEAALQQEQRSGMRGPLFIWRNVLSPTDRFVLLFGITLIVSYFLSVDRTEALWGTEGWNMGVMLYGLLCVLYFQIRSFWIPDEKMIGLILTASGAVLLLGVLDRFSLHVIPLEIRDPGFLSTLGNINWFTGYLIVFVSVAAGLFVLTDQAWMKLLTGVVSAIGFLAGICQGSSSIFLYFACLFAVLLWIAADAPDKCPRLLFLWVAFCLDAQVIRLLRELLPDGYTYETDNLCGYFSQGNLSLYLLVIGACVILVLQKCLRKYPAITKYLRRLIAAVMIAFPVVFAGIALQKAGILESFVRTESAGALLQGDVTWGNGRGMTYRIGFLLLSHMSPVQWLFGVGPDCFASYAYSVPEVAAEISGYFGNDRLTNAHCEILTMLVNQGLAGTICYLGMFAAYLRTGFMKKSNPYSMSIAVAVICYLLHNLVSFANVLNLPFLIILLAMGENDLFFKRDGKKLRDTGIDKSVVFAYNHAKSW